MKKSSFLRLISLAALAVGPQAAHAIDPSHLPQVPSAIQNDLLAYASPYLKTISPGREVHLYNWIDRDGDLFRNADPDSTHASFLNPWEHQVKAILGFVEGQFRDASGGGTAIAGDGIYAALDPVATVAYAGGDPHQWVLSQFVMVGGARFLDTMGEAGFPPALSQEIAASSLNCSANTVYGLFGGARTSPGCQALRDVVVHGLGFEAYRYEYTAGRFATCPDHPQGAFVLFGDYGTNWPRWTSFTAPLPANSPRDAQYGNRLLIQGMFQLASSVQNTVSSQWAQHQSTTSAGGIDSVPWPALQGKADVTATEAWMKDHIMGCGGYEEDKPGPRTK